MTERLSMTTASLLLFSLAVAGQVSTASLQGTVKDQTGASIPGVTVIVQHTETGMSRTLTTDESGRYVAPQLPIGAYEVRAELPGFRTEIRRGITLTVGQQAVIDLVLSVGAAQEVVEVIGEAPRVQTTSSTVAQLVDAKTMRELPLNGRNFVQLATLQPGVIFSERAKGTFPLSSGTGMKINVNGGRDNSNSFLLDGQNIQDVFNSTPASGGGETLGVDTLAEFEVKTANFSAEYSKAAGAVINAVTKSGTNDIHGSAFGFVRNDKLDAANFFDNAFQNGKPKFRRGQFGATLGGPVIRNKTFFFGGYEGIREARGLTRQFIVPSNDARQGRLLNPATGLIEQITIAPSVQPFLNSFLLTPNGRDFGDGRAERNETRTVVKNDDFFVVKADHRLSGSDSFFARYNFDDGRLNTPAGQIFSQGLPTRNQSAAIQEQRTFSPTLINTFLLGYNRSNIKETDIPLINIPANLFFVPDSGLAGTFSVPGWAGPGNGTLRPRQFIQNVFELSNATSLVRGPHQIKFGANVQRFQAFFDQGNHIGSYTFSSIRNFLIGQAATYNGPLEHLDTIRGMRQTLAGFFAQNDYKIHPRFTVNLGLRYEFITVPTEVNGKLANLRSLLAPQITVGDPFFRNPSFHNFEPRVGFAWDVFGDSKTSLRSGFGIFHNQILPNIYRTISLGNAPFSGQKFQVSPPFPGAQATAPTQANSTAASFPFDLPQPTTYQWNLTIQRQVVGGIVASIGYIGTRGLHLPWSLSGQDRNLALPAAIINGRKFFAANSPRANPAFSTISAIEFGANSFYHGLQIGVRRQSAKGLQFQASYTFSKSIDEASGIFGANGDFGGGGDSPADPLDPRSERGPSAFDARHTFVTNFLYSLPLKVANRNFGILLNGWQANGIVNLSSPLPFSVLVDGSTDRTRNLGRSNFRPDLVPGRSNNPKIGDPRRWFDPTAFALPPVGFYGNLGRNTLRGDAFKAVDLGLQKNTQLLGERLTVQFRAEFFNILNRPNFQSPAIRTIFVADNPTPLANSGQVTETANPARQIQFSMKLIW